MLYVQIFHKSKLHALFSLVSKLIKYSVKDLKLSLNLSVKYNGDGLVIKINDNYVALVSLVGIIQVPRGSGL